jgi:restriction system protein
MPIPTYQDLFLPFLRFLGDRRQHPIKEVFEHICNELRLTDEERERLLPTGKQTVIGNRVGWARTYLKKAGMLTYARRGIMQITPRGSEYLSTNPTSLTRKDFKRYSDYDPNWVKGGGEVEPQPDRPDETSTPEEQIEAAFGQLNDALAASILDQIGQMSPAFFERLVVDLLLKMGYGGSRRDAGHAVGRSGDEGIDGIIQEDKLGLDAIYLQAKRWQGTIGRPEIQKFMGALAGKKATKGVFITTSSFTEDARDYAVHLSTKIALIDGKRLAALMIEHDVGVTPQTTYTVKRLDADYFSEE